MSDSRKESAPVARLGLAAIGRRLPARIMCPPDGPPRRDHRLPRRAARDRRLRRLRPQRPAGARRRARCRWSSPACPPSASCSSAPPRRAPQLVLCHHGLFWDFMPRAIGPAMKRRLELLFGADISVAAYHLPLDAHPEVGNNALICAALGLERAEPFAVAQGPPARLRRAARLTGSRSRSCAGAAPRRSARSRSSGSTGPRSSTAWASCRARAHGDLSEAISLGLDAFLTGEPAEHVMADARESGVHFVAGGHYATERFGVRQARRAGRRALRGRARFVDIPNPI